MKTYLFLAAALVFAVLVLGTALSERSSVVRAQSGAGHDVAVTSVETYGPSAVNLSDTNGRYMWVMAYFANESDHTEMVNLALEIPEAVPEGCERHQDLIIPGQPSQVIAAGDEKYMIWRVRYECHAPTTFEVVPQTVTVGVTHCDPSTSLLGPITGETPGGPCPRNSQPGGAELDLSDNTFEKRVWVLVK